MTANVELSETERILLTILAIDGGEPLDNEAVAAIWAPEVRATSANADLIAA